jgi:hypothetical protein
MYTLLFLSKDYDQYFFSSSTSTLFLKKEDHACAVYPYSRYKFEYVRFRWPEKSETTTIIDKLHFLYQGTISCFPGFATFLSITQGSTEDSEFSRELILFPSVEEIKLSPLTGHEIRFSPFRQMFVGNIAHPEFAFSENYVQYVLNEYTSAVNYALRVTRGI